MTDNQDSQDTLLNTPPSETININEEMKISYLEYAMSVIDFIAGRKTNPAQPKPSR